MILHAIDEMFMKHRIVQCTYILLDMKYSTSESNSIIIWRGSKVY